MLYECLAGGPPFTGQPGEVLRQHLSSARPSLAGRALPAARALDWAGAAAAAEGARRRATRRRAACRGGRCRPAGGDCPAGESDPSPGSGAAAARPVLTEPGFVGRAAELAALQAALDAAARLGGRLVCVEGESGGGKTRLLDELAGRQGPSGAWVLRGQGVDASAQGPFQVLGGVVEGIAALTRGAPPLGAALAGRIGEDLDTAATTLPGLAEALALSAPPAPACRRTATPDRRPSGRPGRSTPWPRCWTRSGRRSGRRWSCWTTCSGRTRRTVRLLRRWRHGAGRASGADGEAPAGDATGRTGAGRGRLPRRRGG